MDLRAPCNNKISAGRVPRRANRSGQVPIRVERKRSNLYLAARAAPFLGIHNKAPPPGLKNDDDLASLASYVFAVRLQTHFDLLPPRMHTNAPTRPGNGFRVREFANFHTVSSLTRRDSRTHTARADDDG